MGFSAVHPAVSAVYFASVLMITMFSANPFLLAVAAAGGIAFYLKTGKSSSFLKELGIYGLLFIVVAVSNPLFSHNGNTVLFFLNNNPVTLESFFYGINIAVMLVAVIFWFKCFNEVMTSEKLLFLFGKLSPKLALVLSSALRFIPLLKRQSKKIKEAQISLGLFSADSWYSKIKSILTVYSALISRAFEDAVDIGSSMKARGYGLKGKTRYSLFKFRKSDAFLLVLIIVSDGVIMVLSALGAGDFSFYPSLQLPGVDKAFAAELLFFAFLCFLPFLMEMKESLMWKYYKSKI